LQFWGTINAVKKTLHEKVCFVGAIFKTDETPAGGR